MQAMQIFIGKIPAQVTEEGIREYFKQFGEISELILKDTFGFLSFTSEDSVTKVLNQRSHVIDGGVIAVEKANGRKRSLATEYSDRYADVSRAPYDRKYVPRAPYETRPMPPGRYEPRYPDNRYAPQDYYRGEPMRMGGDPRRDREYCDYCNGCPIHGIRETMDLRKRHQPLTPKDYPNNYLKVVFENIAPNTSIEDFKTFLRENGFEPTYARLGYTGNHAVIEFKNFDDKDNSMKQFDGADYHGHILKTRSYLPKDEYKIREKEPHVKNENTTEANAAETQSDAPGAFEGDAEKTDG
ncbi:hypothetical protein OCOL_000019 [Ordospora colligata]